MKGSHRRLLQGAAELGAFVGKGPHTAIMTVQRP